MIEPTLRCLWSSASCLALEACRCTRRAHLVQLRELQVLHCSRCDCAPATPTVAACLLHTSGYTSMVVEVVPDLCRAQGMAMPGPHASHHS